LPIAGLGIVAAAAIAVRLPADFSGIKNLAITNNPLW
jgi:hypothetical protein